MPTPFCKNEKYPRYNGELCVCDFCTLLYEKQCPKFKSRDPCIECLGGKINCDKFDGYIYNKMLENEENNN